MHLHSNTTILASRVRPESTRWALRRIELSLLLVILASVVNAGDLTDIKARGKMSMLCFAKQDSKFVQARLDVMRQNSLKLTDLRDPDHFKGSDVELMKAFAQSLGVPLEIRSVTTGYDALIPALLNREGDAIASSLSITKQRLELVDFSDPYLSSWVVVAALPGSNIASLADLNGKRAVLMRGSSQLEFLKAAAPQGMTVSLTDFTMQSYLAVTEHEADFTLLDSDADVGEQASPAYPELRVAFRFRPFDY